MMSLSNDPPHSLSHFDGGADLAGLYRACIHRGSFVPSLHHM